MKRLILKTGILILLGIMINYYGSMRIPVPVIASGKQQLFLDGCVTAIVIWLVIKIVTWVYEALFRIKLKRDERYVLSGQRLKELGINTAAEYLKYLWTMLYGRPFYIHLPFVHLELTVPRKHTEFGKEQYNEIGQKLIYRFFDEMAEMRLPVYDWGKVNRKLMGYRFLEYAVAAQCVKQEHPGLSLDMMAIYPMEQAFKLFAEHLPPKSECAKMGNIRLIAFIIGENGQPDDIYYIEDNCYWKKDDNNLKIFK